MAKYCVYDKGNAHPIEVWEYIDDLEEALQYWYVRQAIKKYGVDKVMPICMNKCGGYHTCWKPDVKCIIEADEWPNISTHRELFLKDINNPSFRCGWIDTLGNTYMCSYMGHASLASSLVLISHKETYTKWRVKNNGINAPDDFLLEMGWIKVCDSSPYHICFYDKTTNEAISKLDEVERANNRITDGRRG